MGKTQQTKSVITAPRNWRNYIADIQLGGDALPVPPRPNAIATDAELVDGQIKVRGVPVLLWDKNGPEAAEVAALVEASNVNGGRGRGRHKKQPPRDILAAHPPPTALGFARTIKDMVVAADGGAMKLNEVVVAYDAMLTEGAFVAHLKKVHKEPTWYPKTGNAQSINGKIELVFGLARYFNSSVDEIDVFILQSNAREIKLDDFRGSMASLSGGKKDKLGLNMLKRAIKFRRV